MLNHREIYGRRGNSYAQITSAVIHYCPDAMKYRLYPGMFIAWLQQREKEGGNV